MFNFYTYIQECMENVISFVKCSAISSPVYWAEMATILYGTLSDDFKFGPAVCSGEAFEMKKVAWHLINEGDVYGVN